MTAELLSLVQNAQAEIEHGWCSKEKAEHMAQRIVDLRPVTVVEIGVFGARSLVPQALALKANGYGRIYGIDPWRCENSVEGEVGIENHDWWRALDHHQFHCYTMEQVWKFGVADQCVVIRAPAHQCHELFSAIDILHIDGNHSEFASVRDVTHYLPLVRSAGLIWFDDSNWTSTQKAIQLILEQSEMVMELGGTCTLYRKK